MYDLKDAYSLVVMSPKELIAARDPHGFRPLCMGRGKDGSVGVVFERDIELVEIVVVNDTQVMFHSDTLWKEAILLCV